MKGRLDLRVDEQREDLIRRAAQSKGRTITDFVLDAAVAEAQQVLTDRRHFAIDDDAWQRFLAALERPASEKPRLRALLERPSILER
ncbi:MAG: DUF1778 domain-containing protein [Chloroflexota bacterium]|nr:DUF1778 domain-containing protein [Chloroflexota bacterium]